MVLNAELKSTNRILASLWGLKVTQNVVQTNVDCIICQPVVVGRQTAEGQAEVL